VVSFLTGGIETLRKSHLEVLGMSVGLVEVAAAALYALSILVEILLLTSVYLVMPVGRITFRHAMLGGVTATLLWEATRRLLVWYFGSLSLVNIIYGSLAAVVVALLTIEAAAVIVLLEPRSSPNTSGRRALLPRTAIRVLRREGLSSILGERHAQPAQALRLEAFPPFGSRAIPEESM